MTEQRSATESWARLLWPRNNPGATIYGTIIAAALVATEAGADEGTGTIVGSVLATLVVYWLAHVYADVTARQALGPTEERRRIRWHHVVESITQELGIIAGGLLVLVVLVLVDLVGGSESVAVDAAQLSSVAQLVAWGVFAARRAHLTGLGLALYALASAALGVLIALLKIALH